MSEHIQPAPPLTSREHERPEEHEHTPGVTRESEAFNFWLIVWVGIGLAAFGLGVHVGVGLLLGGLEEHHAKQPPSSVSELALEDAKQPLGRRVDSIPGPRLEGIERESSIFVVRTENGEEHRFFSSSNIHVRIEKKEARLFDLREGQRVTLAYYMPGGAGGGLGIVTSVTSPPVEAEKQKASPELPDVTRTLNGTILKIEPLGIDEARQWAEVRRERYGWIDRDKEIVHIPVEKAMEQVLRSKEFASASDKNKAAGGKR